MHKYECSNRKVESSCLFCDNSGNLYVKVKDKSKDIRCGHNKNIKCKLVGN